MSDSSSSESESVDDIEPIVDERIGHFLSSTPPVAKQILKHLSAKDLNCCGRVCKLWSEIASVIKKKRLGLLWMFQATLYPGMGFNEEDSHCTKDSSYICDEDDPWGVGNHFYELLETSTLQPQYGVMFCSTRILSKPTRYFADYEPVDHYRKVARDFYYHEPFMQFLSQQLPRNCRMVCCGAPGIVGTPVDGSVPSEVKQLTGFSNLMFTNIPGVEIHPFSIAEEEGYTARKRKKFDESEIAALTGIPENTNVKALLIFCEEVPDRGGVTRAVVQHYLKKQEMKIALGGAIVESVVAPMAKKDEWPMVAGISFTGDNLNAASFVIQPYVRSEEELEKNLREFKNGVRLGSKSIAFMFACCGKGCNYYDEPNMEPKTFRKVFPDTLLFGCFSNGEIGITHLPNPEAGKRFKVESKPSTSANWVHGYTTIFVLLTW